MRQYFSTSTSKLLKQTNHKELSLIASSFLYFFCLLCSYFILRPLRDEMGIVNGAINMQWLFTGTFVAMLCIVPIFSLLVSRNSIKKVLLFSYSFFIGNVLLFYLLFEVFGISKIIAVSFFIWLSVFNLFVVSLFWSFMADVFSSKSSKRFFGIIASGGSLGALTGPIIANHLSSRFSISILLLVAALFLTIALLCILGILKLSSKKKHFNTFVQPKPVNAARLFEAVQNIAKSPYLLGIVAFVVLYTSISTVLYFEQAHIVEEALTKSAARIRYFSSIDFKVNAIAIIGQFFFTGSIIKRSGLSMVLASIPFIMGIGLVVLGLYSSLSVIAMLMVIHRAGNFMLLRPSKEILFTVSSFEDKYKAKNFIDTAIYRGGDALVGWLFAGLIAIGWGLGAIAFLAIPISFLWSFIGYRLGKQQLEKENVLTLNNKI
ncbi:MFS transporter [Flagellimonas aquimarina]|uniref:MFS transporter n=1 Tax=Flagellimonas aquimarina TaxID=2201895 RepID=A0A316KYT0_9FLAO|nr:MFS transporter [Allomuricauda koreensis]PWL38731.1 MFS transporter [Allomuricauda koreensis]